MVGTITITIERNADLRYSPSPDVRRGDIVTFKLHDVPYEVEIQFDDASCFSNPGPFYLNGSNLLTSESLHTVATNASLGEYPFTVTIFDGTARSQTGNVRKGGELETKKGGIDVTTDPPKDPKKK